MIFQVFQGLVFRLVLIGFDLVFPGVVFGISCGIDWIWFGIFFGVFTSCLVLLQYQIPDRDMSVHMRTSYACTQITCVFRM